MRRCAILAVLSHFRPAVSLQKLPPDSVAYFLVNFASTRNDLFGGVELFPRRGRGFSQKPNFSANLTILRFCQLPSASVSYFLVEFAATRNSPRRGGGCVLRVARDLFAITQFPGLLFHFCVSVSFRSLLRCRILLCAESLTWGNGIIYIEALAVFFARRNFQAY